MLALLGDTYAPFSVAQLVIPFISDYRPLWVGIGVIAGYLALLVTVTFYLRKRIGYNRFRAIHYASFLAYIGAAIHGIFAGTDATLGTTQLVYLETALVVILLTAYWLWRRAADKRPSQVGEPLSPP